MLAVLGLERGDDGLGALPGHRVDVAPEIRDGPGEVDPLGLRLGQELRDEEGRAGDQRHALEAIERARLRRKRRALGGEEREEDPVRPGSGELREHGRHVRLALRDPGGDRDLSADRAKRVPEGVRQRRRVGIPVVERDDPPKAQLAVGEVRHGPCLVEVVVGDAEIAGVVVGVRIAGQIRGQHRRCGARRDHDVPVLADHRRGGHGGRGARGPDDAQDLRIGDDLPGAGPPAIGGAPGIQRVAQVDDAAANRAHIADGKLHAAPRGNPERRRPRHRQQRTDPHRLAARNRHRPERSRLEARWPGASITRDRECRDREYCRRNHDPRPSNGSPPCVHVHSPRDRSYDQPQATHTYRCLQGASAASATGFAEG